MFKKLIIPLFIILLLGLGFWNLKQKNQESTIPNTKAIRDFKANLTINNGTDTLTFDASSYVGKTALEATLDMTNGKVITAGTNEAPSVTSINGREVDSGKREFWELFVNGLSSKQWAGKYVIKDGDQIEWHINKKSE